MACWRACGISVLVGTLCNVHVIRALGGGEEEIGAGSSTKPHIPPVRCMRVPTGSTVSVVLLAAHDMPGRSTRPRSLSVVPCLTFAPLVPTTFDLKLAYLAWLVLAMRG
eukprot:293533-Chlamydomonas_euryale.AAC.2